MVKVANAAAPSQQDAICYATMPAIVFIQSSIRVKEQQVPATNVRAKARAKTQAVTTTKAKAMVKAKERTANHLKEHQREKANLKIKERMGKVA